MDGDLEAARKELARLERALAERDQTIAELEEALKASPLDQHRLRVRQLKGTLAALRQDVDQARTRVRKPPDSQAAIALVVILAALALYFATCQVLMGHR